MMKQITIQQMTCARIPTPEGEFQLCLYHNDWDDKEHLALVLGQVADVPDVLVRVHSECFTGDVLGSLRCDCGPQLQQAMRLIAAEGRGVILYLRQEGRGIGLLDKLRAYNLQDQGYDTVEANLLLGHQADGRDYTVAAAMLQDLGVRSLRLLTNNPSKIDGLQQFGLEVAARVPLETAVTEQNGAYLATKVKRMRHLLNLENGNGRFPTLHPPKIEKRPFVTLSYAQSLDGSITARHGQPTALSGQQAMTFTHRLRASHNAILVGIGTILADDPRLTVRLTGGRQPQPVVLDSRLRFPLTAELLHHPNQPWIITTSTALADREQALTAVGATIIRLPQDAAGRVSLPHVLEWLASQSVRSLMVEGGGTVMTAFLQQQLVDRLVLTIAPRLLGGFRGVGQLLPPGTHLQDVQYEQVGADLVVMGEVVYG